MNEALNGTVDIIIPATGNSKHKARPLSEAQLEWITFTATQGMSVLPDGSVKKMTVDEFAFNWNVGRRTLFNWRKTIPNFWDLVGEKVMEIFSGNRTVKVVNAMFLAATVKLDTKAMAMWMANQKLVEFRMPTQEVKHEAGDSWAALMATKSLPLLEENNGEDFTD